MDWVLSEIEVQERALAIWRRAAFMMLTNGQPETDEADAPAVLSGKEKGAVGRPVLRPESVQKP